MPYSQQQKQEDLMIVATVWGLTAVIFALDMVAVTGLTVWVFYVIPQLLSVKQRNRNLPLMLAAAQAVLLIVGLFPLATTQVELRVANRIINILSVFSVAYLAYAVIGARERTDRLLWLQRGQSDMAAGMLGELELSSVGRGMLQVLSRYVNAQVAALYTHEQGRLGFVTGYAFDAPDGDADTLGLAREVARDGKPLIVDDVPSDHVRISSGTGGAAPRRLLIAPVTAEGRIVGVVELGFVSTSMDMDRIIELMRILAEDMGQALSAAMYRQRLKDALEETERQREILQTQQEELRATNEELEEQSRALRDSQSRLEDQQSELEQTNVRLEEQANRLERQKQDLLRAQRTLEANADELTRANRYKSEFLANMSHELRTPLNSSLILAQILSGHDSATLSSDEVRRYAQTIHASNQDLLTLINDILDLSKIEAGHVDIVAEPVSVAGVLRPLQSVFEPISRDRGVAMHIEIDADTPATFTTDSNRLQQVLKNLLSNAFKFTEKGSVTLRVCTAGADRVAFEVRDTGIGIAPEQQDIIFEAFRQADGTTSRKYGGTGLGLSISRELARLLGGEIRVASEPGRGSTFTLEVATELEAGTYARDGVTDDETPAITPAAKAAAEAEMAAIAAASTAARKPAVTAYAPAGAPKPMPGAPLPRHLDDDRERRQRSRLVLVIEDDERFAAVLYEVAHELDFDCIHAVTGEEALALARSQQPSGILLDVNLPDQSGLSVLERLKRDPVTRHIPVHMLSVHDHLQTALELGAVGYALKPVARESVLEAFQKVEARLQQQVRRVLVVEDDAVLRESIGLMLKAGDVEITTTGTVAQALEYLAAGHYDCMVMDLMLPDASGYDLLEQMASGEKYAFPPVIVYTGRALTRDEEQRLRRYSRSIIIKGAKSPERLLDEVSLFLHRIEAALPQDQQRLLAQARQRDAVFEGRRILLAEDDVRNVYALSSIFEPLGAKLIVARDGRQALERLATHEDIDLVLMDLMMPEMDGLTAMREIRRQPAYARLPIIALTAKAMADDRRSCLEAGADDYIAKPIDVEKLVSLCRVWMPK
ncbi:two component sensor kinase for capsular biosynthesis [Bordetella ansorpii]|uniref:Virulence sensor protein BvgS n=1 Tax=Bordetella ansorpii TaxID=288768 RepID=A0A157ME16_9BORD|nr:response regulator [Bordetella ansorpii]SAI07060.1 two component sensor kinase for capsular biosynthesis [Bordetella ansorpii]